MATVRHLGTVGRILRPPTEYPEVFIAVQNFVGIAAVILIIWKFEYSVHNYSCTFFGWGGENGENGNFVQF